MSTRERNRWWALSPLRDFLRTEAAGGALLGMDGKPLRYNCSESLLSPHFFAIADAGHPLWRELLASRRF